MTTVEQNVEVAGPLAPEELRRLDAYWRAANYLSVGQIYLLANPLLREPLRVEHIKPRLLGHWGTTPGLNFVYAHMIADVARGFGADVVVVGTRGHTAIGGLLLGSVTQRLLHIATCPVLAIPGKVGAAKEPEHELAEVAQ